MEVIVVDAGSRDRTHEIALEFQQAEPGFVRIHRLSSEDADAARAAGLALACGKYVAFCGASDIVPPEMYQVLYDVCEEHALEFAGSPGANIWDRGLENLLARRDFLLVHGLPVKSSYDRNEQLAAYETLRKIIGIDDLPLFCAGWLAVLRGVCLEEYKKSRGGAAFFEAMISLADEPQVMETMALAQRGALDRGHRKFYDAFKARDWVKVEKRLKNSRSSWRGARPSPASGRCGTSSSRPRPGRRP